MAAERGRVEELEEELEIAQRQVESMKKELAELKESARDLRGQLEDEEDRLVLANYTIKDMENTIKNMEKQNEIAKQVRAASIREHTERGIRLMQERDKLKLRLKQQEEEAAHTVSRLEGDLQEQRCQREALEHSIKPLQAEGASYTNAAQLQAQLAELQVKLAGGLKAVAAACQALQEQVRILTMERKAEKQLQKRDTPLQHPEVDLNILTEQVRLNSEAQRAQDIAITRLREEMAEASSESHARHNLLTAQLQAAGALCQGARSPDMEPAVKAYVEQEEAEQQEVAFNVCQQWEAAAKAAHVPFAWQRAGS